MRRHKVILGIAASCFIALGTLGPAGAFEPQESPPRAADTAVEPDFDAYDPSREAGERLTSLLTPSGDKPDDRRLPSLDAGIIGVLGSTGTGYTVVVGTDADLGVVSELIFSGLSEDAQRMIGVQQGGVSAEVLQLAWAQVNRALPALLRGKGAYWLDVDPVQQQVVVGVDETLVDKELGKSIESISSGVVGVIYEGGGERAVRATGDAAPHWGGAIISPDNRPYPETWCSAGFTVKRNGVGARASVTAGHCGTPGGNGGDWNSRSYFYGTKAGTSGYPDYDQARLQGSTYNPYIYTGGGDDGQTFRSVRGATDPVIGDLLCQSGVTSESECDIRIGSVTAEYCDDPAAHTGCTTYLASGRRDDDTIVIRGGDSGGPVYLRFSGAEAGIRGMGIASYDNGRRMFAERYNSIANHLNVTIVTVN